MTTKLTKVKKLSGSEKIAQPSRELKAGTIKATAVIQKRLNAVAFGPISSSLKRIKIGEKERQIMLPNNATKESIGNDKRN